MAKAPKSTRSSHVTNMGDNPVIAQYVGTINTEIVHKTQQKIENPTAFYLPTGQSDVPSEREQVSNIERKMKPLGPAIVKHAQTQRSRTLIHLQKFASLSEYSGEHLQYVMELLEFQYTEVFVTELNLSGNHFVAYRALMESLETFATQHHDEVRLPLNKPMVAGLLFNSTGVCNIDWTA